MEKMNRKADRWGLVAVASGEADGRVRLVSGCVRERAGEAWLG